MGAIFRGRKCYTGKIKDTSQTIVRFPDLSSTPLKTFSLPTGTSAYSDTYDTNQSGVNGTVWLIGGIYLQSGSTLTITVDGVSVYEAAENYGAYSKFPFNVPVKKGGLIRVYTGGGHNVYSSSIRVYNSYPQ